MATGQTAFVTGATGFLGLNLVEALVAAGWDVTAMHRATSDLSMLERFPVRRVEGDVTKIQSLRAVMPKNVDTVFHVAGNTSLWSRSGPEQLRVNVRGTRNVVRVALEHRARRLVYTSSVVAFGLHSGVISELTPTRGNAAPIAYVRSKALAEREVRHGLRKGLDAVIVNPSNMIGPYDTHNWSRLFRLVKKRRLPGVPPGGGSFCDVRDVAQAHLAAAKLGRLGANYLLGGNDASYRNLVQSVAAVLGHRRRYMALPARVLGAYASIEELLAPVFGRDPDVTRDAVTLLSQNIYCSSRRASEELGYQTRPLEQTLRDCHAWLQQAGRL